MIGVFPMGLVPYSAGPRPVFAGPLKTFRRNGNEIRDWDNSRSFPRTWNFYKGVV